MAEHDVDRPSLRPFTPFLAPQEREELHELLSFAGPTPPGFAQSLRQLAREYIDEGDSAKLRAVCLLVADLLDQGWHVTFEGEGLHFKAPGIETSPDQTVDDIKLRIRSALQVARLRQLSEPSVATFIQRMERRTLRYPGVRSSVLDLIDDGAAYQASIQEGGRVRPMHGAVKVAGSDTDWLRASEDFLFVRKRAELLAQLLFAKQMFRAAGLASNSSAALDQLLSAKSGQRAIDIALTEFRKAGLSSRVADVSICGAIAPYNELLGGKLVALLLASKEVRDHYSDRYSGQVSVIASQMAGRAISKPADLCVLTTTSLYGVGSSQYNRLGLRAAEHEGLTHNLRWDSIGRSKTGGFGTLHLGQDTAHALRQMAQSLHTSRRVNNRFGEGTSPRLRQIREGLDALGIASDSILHHATPRLFYACELGAGSRNSLMGLSSINAHAPSSAAISAAWRRRWLDGRIRRDATIAALEALGPGSVQRSLKVAPENNLLTALHE